MARAAWRHAAIVPVVILAAWLRFNGLRHEHLYGDEAEYAIVARSLSRDMLDLTYPSLQGMVGNVFVSQPPLVLYLMAMSMKVFGANDFAALMPLALLGTLTVVAVYAVAYRLGGRLAAIPAAFVIAVLPFHVSMSRNAMLDVGYAFFLVCTAYFLVAWLQERRARHAALAGVAATAAALSKLPGLLVLPWLVLILLVAGAPLVVQRLRGHEVTPQAKLLARHAAIAAAPLALGALAYAALLDHLGALDDLQSKLAWNAGRVQGDGDPRLDFYLTDPRLGFGAQLGAGVFALAISGLGFGLFRFAVAPVRAAERIVVPALVLVLLAFFSFSDRKVGFYILPFAPLAAILVGTLASDVRDMVQWASIQFVRRDLRWIGSVGAAIALVIIAFPAGAAYEQSKESYGDRREGSTFGYGFGEAAAWIHDQDPGAGQYGTLLGRFTLRWYNEHETFHRFSGPAKLDEAIAEGRLKYVVHDRYVNDPQDAKVIARLLAQHGVQEHVVFERSWGEVHVYEIGREPMLP